MNIYKAYKFRLYPSLDQEVQINKSIGCNRFVFNQAAVHDRDENAAKNILKEGKRLLTVGQTGIA